MTSTDLLKSSAVLDRLVHSGPARLLSLLAAGLFSLLIMLFPQLVIEQGQPPQHGLLVLGLWGMAAGFVHGVGFVPRGAASRLLFGPFVAWLLLAASTFLLFNF
jgi:predicted membrane protein